jgi:hypothetical protein
MLNAAVDDGVILANPADKLGRLLKLVTPAAARQEEIKAMTRDQVSAFVSATLAATNSQDRGCYPLFLLLARTGIGYVRPRHFNGLTSTSGAVRFELCGLCRLVASSPRRVAMGGRWI